MTKTLILCRSALEPLGHGNVLGHDCQRCRHPLQVTPQSLETFRKGDSYLVCNPCGRDLAAKLGSKILHAELGPKAAEQWRDGHGAKPDRDFIRSLFTQGKIKEQP